MESRCRHVHRPGRVGEVARAQGAPTPGDYAIRLTVTESYGARCGRRRSRTSSTQRARCPRCTIPRRSSAICRWHSSATSRTRRCRRRPASRLQRRMPREGGRESDIESNREHFVDHDSSLRLQNVRVEPERHDGEHAWPAASRRASPSASPATAAASLAASAPSPAIARYRRSTSSSAGGCAPATSTARGAWVPIVLLSQAELTLR